MIRPVTLDDAEAIRDIYNHYIENTVITFEQEPISVADIKTRIDAITSAYSWLVSLDQDKITGYAYINAWKSRAAYAKTVEISVYLRPDACGLGYGAQLYQDLLTETRRLGFHLVLAGIALPNPASVALHEKFGFTKGAHFAEIGFKHGQWIDVGYWQYVCPAST